MYNTRRTTSRFVILFLLLAMAVLALAGCDSGSSSGPASPADQGTTVSGQVVYKDTGQPYAGAIVELRNLNGWEVHTTTDSAGHYTLTLPSDTYTVEALDLNNLYEDFAAVGLTGNSVSVPPSTTINFVAFPAT